MKRLTLFIAVALLATLAPMGSASARGDGWTFLEAADFTAPACGTDIAETFVANKEYAKFAVDADGVLHFIVVTGVLKVRVTDTATGRSVLVNASARDTMRSSTPTATSCSPRPAPRCSS